MRHSQSKKQTAITNKETAKSKEKEGIFSMWFYRIQKRISTFLCRFTEDKNVHRSGFPTTTKKNILGSRKGVVGLYLSKCGRVGLTRKVIIRREFMFETALSDLKLTEDKNM